ncbi:MAG: TolC family protein [Deltaproteobacteria bacterium]|nr:TolC family protein [Deltaproteobacteria bacterium]
MMKRNIVNVVALAVLLAAPGIRAQGGDKEQAPAAARRITLTEALKAARERQPDLAVARAQTAGAQARVNGALAPLLPQVTGNASYSRQTANTPGRAGTPAIPATSSWNTQNSFSFGARASQLLWDFGTAWNNYRGADVQVSSYRETESAQLRVVLLGVRVAFFTVMADKAVVDVAADNLAAQERHLAQVEGFVKAGARPEFDLAQIRSDVANARLQLVNARSAYESGKADLNKAMGLEQTTDYDVAEEELAPIDVEEAPEEQLVDLAVKARPELRALARQSESQERQISAAKGEYWPNVGVSTGVNDTGTDIQALTWNWDVTATLTWPLFQGGATRAQVEGLEAARMVTNAQLEGQRQQIRQEVVRARLQLEGAKAAVDAAAPALASAQEALRLAEARYQAGAGSIIEMQDAQVAVVSAKGQTIEAAFNVSLARAQLLKALGRE